VILNQAYSNGDDDTELNETARLIIMDNESISMGAFGATLRRNMSRTVTLREIGWMWGKYRGFFNGATPPTHDVETGKPIRPERAW